MQGQIKNGMRRGRPRAADANEKRAKILQVAAVLFAEKGFNKTSFASIAEAMDMTLAGVTHYFPRKIDVLLSVLSERDAEYFRDGYPIDPKHPLDILNRLMERDIRRGAQMTRMFLVLATEAMAKTHPAHVWFKARHMRVFAELRDGLERMRAQGLLQPSVDCAQEASNILAIMEGLQLRWLRDPSETDPVAAFASYLDAVKARILTTP